MAKEIIFLGTSANDGTGDTLREMGRKVNDNFTELYNKVDGYLEVVLVNTTYNGLPMINYTGAGINASIAATLGINSVNVSVGTVMGNPVPGTGYIAGETFIIPGEYIYGVTGVNDIFVTIDTVDVNGEILTMSATTSNYLYTDIIDPQSSLTVFRGASLGVTQQVTLPDLSIFANDYNNKQIVNKLQDPIEITITSFNDGDGSVLTMNPDSAINLLFIQGEWMIMEQKIYDSSEPNIKWFIS